MRAPSDAMTLDAIDLVKTYKARGRGRGILTALDNVSVRICAGQFVAVVGESGSGKTTLGRVLLGLSSADSGEVRLDDHRLTHGGDRQNWKVYRRALQCVLQDSGSAMNPRKRIRHMLGDVIQIYNSKSVDVEKAVIETLESVGLKPGQEYLDRYPHELSGGQRQRVMIGRALIPEPRFLIADEAVSALDLNVKKSVLELFEAIKTENQVGIVLITHELNIVKKYADYIYVMKSGKIVEEGTAVKVFESPSDAYTRTLLAARPEMPIMISGESI